MSGIPEGLSAAEWKLVQEHREKERSVFEYNRGVLDSVNLLESLAEQCWGGSGEGGASYLAAATSVRGLFKQWK